MFDIPWFMMHVNSFCFVDQISKNQHLTLKIQEILQKKLGCGNLEVSQRWAECAAVARRRGQNGTVRRFDLKSFWNR